MSTYTQLVGPNFTGDYVISIWKKLRALMEQVNLALTEIYNRGVIAIKLYQ